MNSILQSDNNFTIEKNKNWNIIGNKSIISRLSGTPLNDKQYIF